MVGTEATTDAFLKHNPRNRRGPSLSAAHLLHAWLACCLSLVVSTASAQTLVSTGASEPTKLLRASGETVYRWQTNDTDSYWLVGGVTLLYGEQQLSTDQALLVIDGEPGLIRTRIVALKGSTKSTTPISMTLLTGQVPQVQAPRYRGLPESPPELLRWLPSGDVSSNVDAAQSGDVAPAQYQQPQYQEPMSLQAPIPVPLPQVESLMQSPQVAIPVNPGFPEQTFPEPPIILPGGATTGGMQFFVGGGTRSIEIIKRGDVMAPQFETINRPEANETVIVARGGITVLIRDVTAQTPSGERLQLGTISLSADRVVGWLPLFTRMFDGSADLSQMDGELFLEGDIVFRQGDRVIYADSMYFNVSKEIGMVLDAEAISTVPNYQGVVRLKADVLQQVSRGNFIAFDAAVTSSRMGVPRYWLQSEQLQLEDRPRTIANPLGGPPIADSQPYLTSTNNFVYLGGIPILYWPTFATNLDVPTYYISGAKVTRDSVFGTQVLLDFNLLQLLGLRNAPPGIDWTLSTDYLSERGPAVGTNLNYNLPGFLGYPGPVHGALDAWVIDDSGTDTLGRDRRDLAPEQSTRGRALLRHQHYLPNDVEFIAELGYLSDRNFLEQYFENEWDQDTDHHSGLALNKYYYNNLFSLSANGQVNDFFQETEELPRFGHYLLGGSVLSNLLTYNAHNRVGYAKLNVADAPINPIEAAKFTTLPGEVGREGLIASTRQELAMPVQAGPVKFVPFVSGEAAHYGEAIDGDALTRLTGQAGLRASLPMWRFDPAVQSSLLNVRGLAHKIEFTGEYFYADSDTNFDELPLYDSLDDNAQEQFRRRFIFDTFGGALPRQFDPRTYALRQGLQSYVTSPSETVADDLQLARIGIHQRFQTKRGLPGRERIVDLLRLDADLNLYPNADRDNFGESIGPATYDLQYNLGDRVALLSDGYIDFFDDGLRSLSAGVRTSRPGLGDVYIGLMSLEGPISSTVLRSTLDYRLNEKYIVSAGSTYDFGSTGNVGQTFGFTRIGESFLVRMGINVDSGRDNVGVGFLIEPRFWPSARLGQIGGQLIPPPGVEGLE